MKMLINYLALGVAFGAVKIAVSPVKLYTNAALSDITVMMKMRPIGPKAGFEKINC